MNVDTEEIKQLLKDPLMLKGLLEEEIKSRTLVNKVLDQMEIFAGEALREPIQTREKYADENLNKYFSNRRELIIYGKAFLVLEDRLDDIFHKSKSGLLYRFKYLTSAQFRKHVYDTEEKYRRACYWILLGKIKDDVLVQAKETEETENNGNR
jgi:ribosomal protein S18 acetylase RimI-like enzyme